MIRIGQNLFVEAFRGRFLLLQPVLFLVVLMGISVEPTFAQDEDLPEGVVPPPLTVLSEDESESLEGQKDLKRRTKLAIELMDGRLASSKASADEEDYDKSLNQLGHFNALMNTTLRNLDQNDYKKSALRSYKRFEMALRQFIVRLELVRRALPYSHSYHVSKLIKSVREARRKSIEPFYDDTVIPDGQMK